MSRKNMSAWVGILGMPGEREGGRHGHVICGAIGGGGGKVQQFINYYYYYYYYYKSCVVCLNCIGMATM